MMSHLRDLPLQLLDHATTKALLNNVSYLPTRCETVILNELGRSDTLFRTPSLPRLVGVSLSHNRTLEMGYRPRRFTRDNIRLIFE